MDPNYVSPTKFGGLPGPLQSRIIREAKGQLYNTRQKKDILQDRINDAGTKPLAKVI